MPYAAFAGCALIWGSTFLAIRIGNDALPALWACALRLILAAILLNGILVASGQRWPKGKALEAALWYGFLEFAVSLPLLYWAEKAISSGLAAIVYAISPVVAMIGSRAMGMEELSPKRLAAAVAAFAGVAVIFWGELAGKGSVAGLIAVAIAASCGSMAAVLLRRGPAQSALGANAVGSTLAVPFSLVATLSLESSHPMPFTFARAFPVLYLAVASSGLAFGLFAWLLGKWQATTVAFLGVIVPVIAVALGAMVRSERFHVGMLAGAAIVIVSVVVAIRTQPPAVEVVDS